MIKSADITQSSNILMLNYVKNPIIKTKTELFQLRKFENKLKAEEFTQKTHPKPSTRLLNREISFYSKIPHHENPNLLKKQLKKKQDLCHFSKQFSKCVYGIHKYELPKFYDIKENFFKFPLKNECFFEENPKNQSKNEKNFEKSNKTYDFSNEKTQIFQDLDCVERGDLEKKGSQMLENFKKLHQTAKSYFLSQNLLKMKVQKELDQKFKKQQSFLMQNRIQSSHSFDKRISNHVEMRTSGFSKKHY